MTPLEKFRQQVAIAKASEPGVKRYVVQTADEAQAVLDEIDARRLDPHLGFLVGSIYPQADDEVV